LNKRKNPEKEDTKVLNQSINTPDTLGDVAVRLMAYTLAGLDHFIQVSLLPDLNKMMPENRDPYHTVIPSIKNCPEY
jgi:hypothetical protein